MTMINNHVNQGGRKKKEEKSRNETCMCQSWSEVGRNRVASSFFFSFSFFFFFSFSSIAQRSRCVNVYRRLFEYGHYYENRKHDNHESLPEVRTMSSSEREILGCGLAQTAIKRFLNDNTVNGVSRGLAGLSSCYVNIRYLVEIVTKPLLPKHLFH